MEVGRFEELVSVPVPRSLITEVYALIAERSGQSIGSDSSPDEWTVEHFQMLIGDTRPSIARIALVLDELAKRPDTAVSTTELAKATHLTRGELRGAFSGFTRVCKMLWPDRDKDIWPMRYSWGPVQDAIDQEGETYYTLRRSYAERWKEARSVR